MTVVPLAEMWQFPNYKFSSVGRVSKFNEKSLNQFVQARWQLKGREGADIMRSYNFLWFYQGSTENLSYFCEVTLLLLLWAGFCHKHQKRPLAASNLNQNWIKSTKLKRIVFLFSSDVHQFLWCQTSKHFFDLNFVRWCK